MKRAFLAVIAIGVFAPPARAHTNPGATEVSFEAMPCAIACSYWVDNGFTPCEAPFPPGSYDDVITTPAPAPAAGNIVVLEATLDSTVDWDLFLCPHGSARWEVPPGGNILGEPCDNLLGPNNLVPIGCHEDASAPVVAGQTVIMRAYNWSDPFPATGHYWFTEI